MDRILEANTEIRVATAIARAHARCWEYIDITLLFLRISDTFQKAQVIIIVDRATNLFDWRMYSNIAMHLFVWAPPTHASNTGQHKNDTLLYIFLDKYNHGSETLTL